MSDRDDISVSGLTVRPREHDLVVQGHRVDLTAREFEIISRLAEHPGWVLSADQLSEERDEADYSPESVSVHVSRLRHKLSVAGAPDIVETVRGSGYRLRRGDDELDGPSDSLDAARREMRDAAWQLHEAAHEAEHEASEQQLAEVTDALTDVRHAIYRILGE